MQADAKAATASTTTLRAFAVVEVSSLPPTAKALTEYLNARHSEGWTFVSTIGADKLTSGFAVFMCSRECGAAVPLAPWKSTA